MVRPHLFLLLLLFTSITFSSPRALHATISQCLSETTPLSNTSQLFHVPNTPSYDYILRQSMQNLRFSSPSIPKPAIIIVPSHESHVQATVACCRTHGVAVRVRSGGHDYEGLSYRSDGKMGPFAVVDISNLKDIRIDEAGSSAWVHSGATLGELYYRIAEKSRSLAYPGGICPYVGIGGQVSGGGIGTLLRKHGLAADNVLDARVVDARGRVLDRRSMGEDLFWAIRGGGAGSFGVLLAWKLRLVPVPTTVTAFTITRTQEQGAILLTHKWQTIAPNLPDDLFLRVIINQSPLGSGQVAAVFESLYLGNCTELLQLIHGSFPELNLEAGDCNEMSWVESTVYFSGYKSQHASLELLRDRGSQPKRYFKAKSDFVVEPISASCLGTMWSMFREDGAGMMILDPFGGKMDTISDAELPFPHRKGMLYNIQYFVMWQGEWDGERYLRWVEELYERMRPFVSKEPRRAYLNYRDLGVGREGYWGEEGWGRRYFGDNAVRLAAVKGMVDPQDVFRSEQSVPPLLLQGEERAVDGFAEGDEEQQRRMAFVVWGKCGDVSDVATQSVGKGRPIVCCKGQLL